MGAIPNQVDLRGVWYGDPRKRRALHSKIADRPNLALRGLYWLSFDIVGEAANEPDDALAAGAAHLNTLRNALEHRCLVLTTETFGARDSDGIEREGITAFQHNTERMLELVHEALILLSLAMHEEEMRKRRDRRDDTFVVDTVLPEFPTRSGRLYTSIYISCFDRRCFLDRFGLDVFSIPAVIFS